MSKPSSNTKLLILIIGILLVATPVLYLYVDAKHYSDGGIMWKEYWLPIICSLQATLAALFITYLILGDVVATSEQERNEEVAAKITSAMNERIQLLEASIERKVGSVHLQVIKLLIDNKSNEQAVSNKEPEPAKAVKKNQNKQ